MRRMILPLMLFAVAACQPGVAPLTDDDIAALNALNAAFAEGVLAGDADAQVAAYAEDAVYWPADAPAIEGRAAIRAASEPAPGMTIQDFTITSLEIEGYGDLAVDRGTWTETYVVEGVAEATTLTGKYVVVARKQADGSWLWTLLIWNSDAPMSESEQQPE